MANTFSEEDITRGFFDLDLSDSRPSTSTHADVNPALPAQRNQLYQPCITSASQRNGNLHLLAFPVEIRIKIYDLLLVSRFDRDQNPSWAVGNTCQKMIILHMIQAPRYRTMEPAILQTCKQIYHEAVTILYSQNVFNVDEPIQVFRLMTQIGSANFRSIKSLDIWVPQSSTALLWITCFCVLHEKATGLKCIRLGWGADWDHPRERGLGDDLEFVRAFARIRGLQKLELHGYYGKHWPPYLGLQMCVEVDAQRGHYVASSLDNESETDAGLRDLNEKNLQSFVEYQKETEHLIP